jgi:DNA modification methylase
MQIDIVKRSELKPYERNAKKHPQKQIDLLAENIQRFGFTTPVLIDKGNNVIAGHGRLLALEKLQKDDVPCVRMEHLTDEEVKALRLADNKIAELGEWDMDLALEELKGLDDDLLDLTGFEKDLILEPEEKDDEVPEVPEEPQSKLGDLYVLGQHRVLCGDSTKIEDVERLMDGKKADMVFTDPPYGMNLDTDYSKLTSANSFASGKKHSKVIGDDKEYDPTHIFEWFGYCSEILLWGADYYRRFIPDGGSWFCWDKREGESSDKGFGSNFELLWSKNPHKRYMLRYKWFGFFTAGEKREYLHPTQKPVEMLRQVIAPYSKDGDLIVDLFLGSGSTLIASEKTGRICYGMELDCKYTDVIVERYCEYTGNRNIIKNGEQIVWQKTA